MKGERAAARAGQRGRLLAGLHRAGLHFHKRAARWAPPGRRSVPLADELRVIEQAHRGGILRAGLPPRPSTGGPLDALHLSGWRSLSGGRTSSTCGPSSTGASSGSPRPVGQDGGGAGWRIVRRADELHLRAIGQAPVGLNDDR